MVSNVNSVNSVKAAKAAQAAGAQNNNVGNIPIGQKTNVQRQHEALNNFTEQVKAGNVKYDEPNWFLKLLGAENSFIISLNDKNTTLGDIKERYNLADGTMYQNIRDDYGGNRDKYKVPIGPDDEPYVSINSIDLSTATGISEENLKAMVQKN